MLRFLLVALVATAACTPPPTYSMGAATPTGAPRYLNDDEIAAIPNVFPTTLVPPTSAVYQPMYERLVELGNPEKIGQLVSTLVRLGDLRVPITVEECGEIDAYYVPAQRAIRICYEFLAYANQLAGRPEGAIGQDTSATLIFVALHEIGHALIDVLGLSLHSGNEDMADQFAFLVLTIADDTELVRSVVAAPASFLHHHGQATEHDPDDVHRPAEDRAWAGVCMLYGRHRDPQVGEGLGDDAPGCVEQTARVVEAWNELMAEHTRIDTGRMF